MRPAILELTTFGMALSYAASHPDATFAVGRKKIV
jgi:hypothetical protein